MADSDGAVILRFPIRAGMRPPAAPPAADRPDADSDADAVLPARRALAPVGPPVEKESAYERLERQARARRNAASTVRKPPTPRQARKPPAAEATTSEAGQHSGLARMRIAMVYLPNRQTRKYPAQLPRELLTCIEDDGSLLAGGYHPSSDREPRWVTYLDRHAQVTVEIDRQPAVTMWSTVLREGPERDRCYAVMLADWPGIARYERRTGLLLPVVRLDPVDPTEPTC